jgi:drug/metabolite transporter (DMT)-like permease
MKVRVINIATFVGLVCLFFAYGKLNYNVELTLTCLLLVVFTSGCIIDFLLIKKWIETKMVPIALLVVLGLLMGCLSSMVIGAQRHDDYDAGPSFGPATWTLTLCMIYPISFAIFVFSISYLKSKSVQLALLASWVFSIIIYGYYFGDSYTSFKEEITNDGAHYDSVYFPSETKVVTPLLAATVLFWIFFLFARTRRLQKTSSQRL